MRVLVGPSELVLVRHAESRGNVADREAREQHSARLQLEVRDADMPLSELGERQAVALGRHLAGREPTERPTSVISSPYVRARSTAEALVQGSGLELPIRFDERVRERELGAFDGLTGQGIRELHPEEAERRRWVGKFFYRPPSGESWADVVLRVRQLLLNVSLTPAPKDGDYRLWIVTHQAVILAFRYVLEDLSEAEVLEIDRRQPMPNCATTRYQATDDGGWRLEAYADAGPIEGLAPTTRERPTERGPEDAAASA